MRDEFWGHVSSLSQFGKAEFHDLGRPSSWRENKEAAKYSKLEKSMVFSIMRDYMLLDEEALWTHGLGQIYITLPLDKNEEEVFSFFENIIKAAYKMNYLLYRAHYQKEKQRLRTIKANLPS